MSLARFSATSCIALGVLLSLGSLRCSTSSASRKAASAPPSASAAAITKASADFERGRTAALSGDIQCARYYFGRALDTVRPQGAPLPTDPEILAFSGDLYESILRYEALATPPEDVAGGEDHIAPELKKIETPVSSAEEIATARNAVASDTAAGTFDIPVVVNEAVLRIIATFQNDLHDVIARGLTRSGRFLPMIHRIFMEEGIPKDLAEVALIESSFLPHASSSKAAHGLWQFMPRTGRQYGLTSNWVVDERSDPEKATRAAARYLSYLHELFHDWYLAMAAYNAGEGKILRAMEKTGLTDFWQLAASGTIRPQTQNYVPAVIAALLIAKNPVHYGFVIQYEAPLDYETVTLDRPVGLRDLTNGDEVTLEGLQRLNPELRTEVTPRQPEGYELKVPVGTHECVQVAFAAAPTARPPAFRRHVVRRGETLAAIAKRFRVSLASLTTANSLAPRTRLKRGLVILIPEREVVHLAAKKPKKGRGKGRTSRTSSQPSLAENNYRVRGGDTLYRIAHRHGTTVAEILSVNRLSEDTTIRPGDRLKIPPRSR